MILYPFFLVVAAIAAAVLGYFFLWGLSDGSVSSFNIGIWLALVGGAGAILGGGLYLARRGQRGAATAVLALLALPAIAFVLFFGLLILSHPRWN
ncbi:MAG: osmoprotectant transporter permease [Alphaproteobacteria bacterium]|nr:MAG: osmoprotectant transporter permease [Alphaproteobacteria bacterium]